MTEEKITDRETAEFKAEPQEKSAPSRPKRKFSSILTDWLLECALLGFGGWLLWLGFFGDALFLHKFFSFLDVASWTLATKIAFVATILFICGWVKIFLGFLYRSLDDYETALAARYMRMTFFLSIALWTVSRYSAGEARQNLYFAFLKSAKFGQIQPSFIVTLVALVAIGSAALYFIYRWATLKFFERY